MESIADNAWGFAVVGGTIMLGLVLWFVTSRTSGRRPAKSKAATQPRNFDQGADRDAPKAGPGVEP